MIKHREFTGQFRGERQVWESADGQSRTILGAASLADGSEVTLKGEAAEGELRTGLAYRFYGRTVQHWKYGPQFVFDSFVLESPAGSQAVQVYLQQCNGIGPVKASQMWALYGEEAIKRLRESPAEVAAAVKGFKLEDAQEAAEMLEKFQFIERSKTQLLGLLHGRGLPKKTIDRVLGDYGAAAAEVIRRNPYLLMRYRGCGFLKTDKLYLEFGHAPSRLKRQALCAWYAIARNSDGDTWHSLNVARDALAQSIAGSQVRLQDAMQLSLRAGMLSERTDMGTRWISERRKDEAEGRVAAALAWAAEESGQEELLWAPWGSLLCIEELLEGKVSDHQLGELQKALGGIVGVLAGSPGTGKTYTVAALVYLLLEYVGAEHIAAAAPTGKAAVRLTESLKRNGVDMRATTIHSLLKVESSDEGGWSFFYNQSRQLPHKFLLVYEASMIDTDLMASLLSARGRGTHILFIGDPNQLAPVGHGAPLRDMIFSGVPSGHLTEIQRNSGRIVRACAEIRDKNRFTFVRKLDLEAGENLQLIERDAPQQQIETLVALMNKFLEANPHKFDPIWDVQIIVAVNKKRSELGRKTLNPRLQQLLNPHGASAPGSPFRVGDKIVNNKNGWFPAVSPQAAGTNRDGKLYVANGEQAEVLAVEPARTIARLTAPDREIVIPRGNRSDDDDEAATASGDEQQDESTGTGCSWDLAFAISCHKSQGAEWPVVIVMGDEYGGAKMVQSKQWLFTAISRAKTFCLLIGKQSTFEGMCHRDALFKRKTFLAERLKALRPAVVAADPDPAWNDAELELLLEGVC